MLASASDYKYLQVSSYTSSINGWIMPVTAPDSLSCAPVAYEDYLFLTEGYYERLNWLSGTAALSGGPNSIVPAGQTLTPDDLVSCSIENTGRTGEKYYIPFADAIWISNKSTMQTRLSGITGDSWNNGIIQNFELKNPLAFQPYLSYAPLNGFQPYSLSAAEWIRAGYWLHDNMTRAVFTNLKFSFFCTQAMQYTYNSSGQVTYRLDFTDYNTLNRAWSWNVALGRQITQPSFTYRSSIDIPFAKGGWVLQYGTIRTNDGGTARTTRVAASVAVGGSNGITVPTGLFELLMNYMCQACGAIFGSNIEYISLTGTDLVIDFDFPARLNGISWNWQPSYA